MREDPRLIEQLRRRDADAFARQVERYGGKICTLARRMLKGQAEADDLAQDVFLQAWRSLPRFRGDCSFYTWLYRIAVNRILNHLNQRTPRWEALDDTEGDWQHNPERHVMAEALQGALEEAVGRLSEANRMVFVMREVQGMAFEEIADILQCRQDAVRARLHRAKKHLQEMLQPLLQKEVSGVTGA